VICFSCANEQQHATLEFYHIVTIIQEIATASFDQNAKLHNKWFVVVVRKDLWRQELNRILII
jgi:hypothetical protein